MEELEERANLLTQSDYDCMRTGTRKLLSNRELHTLWKEDQIPKYGRRARRKPVLEKKNKVKFECICNIDRSFSRHYVPHFGGGKTKSKEELRTPHFVAFWEEYKDRRNRTSGCNVFYNDLIK